MKFIVIEGLDGAGTTTQTGLLHKKLSDLGISSETTKEPYQGEIYNLIKKILSGDLNYQIYRQSMAWLYMADREFHIRDCIKPALDQGKIIISDRYIPSTMAYQSDNLQVPLTSLYNLNKQSGFLQPDLTVYIKTPVEVCLQRLSQRTEKEIFEKDDFLNQVSRRYDSSMMILQEQGWKILTIDGQETPEKISELICQKVLE